MLHGSCAAVGSADGADALKRFLAFGVANHPKGSEFHEGYSRALARFDELKPYYLDESLTPVDRWNAVNEKMLELMFSMKSRGGDSIDLN